MWPENAYKKMAVCMRELIKHSKPKKMVKKDTTKN